MMLPLLENQKESPGKFKRLLPEKEETADIWENHLGGFIPSSLHLKDLTIKNFLELSQ